MVQKMLFGRRKGHNLSKRQQYLIQCLLPVFTVPASCTRYKNLSLIFNKKYINYELEIGFGGGEHLLNLAINNPSTGFIGAEPFINGMAKILTVIDKNSLSNMRLYNNDARILIDQLPESSLDCIYLLYPDPWIKRRHWKRRFINQKNLNQIARILRPGGIFKFASDIGDYVNWTLSHFHRHNEFIWLAQQSEDWHIPWNDWISTRYEKKAIDAGRTPCYLTFLRK